jgi:hypothetical protein
MSNDQNLLARYGLTLSKNVLRRLQSVGIVVHPQVSLEYQHVAGHYVVRGIECGGAIKDIGRYVTYCGLDGESLTYLHPLDAIGVNGVHSVVVSPAFVRVEAFRVGRTWQLLVTQHRPGVVVNGRRPVLDNKPLFRGINGFIESSDSERSIAAADLAVPKFWSRAGERVDIPERFIASVNAAVQGAQCIGCSHSHYLKAPICKPMAAE